MDEVSYNTRLYPKDTEYTECERCDGDGWIYHEYDGYSAGQVNCPECSGSGQIEITD